MSSSSSSLPLLLTLLFLLHLPPPASASFAPDNLRGLYVFRFGAGSCPARLTFDATSLSIPAQNVSINDSACTEGVLEAATNPSTTEAGLLARYLGGTREAGDFILVAVQEDLVCPARTFKRDATFAFTAANSNFTVSWAAVFANNGTYLSRNSPGGDRFVFAKGKQHMIISNLCMYDRIDIPNPPGRKCFPGTASVTLRSGARLRMSSLRSGDEVSVGNGDFSRVVGFTHASATAISQMVQLRTAGNESLVASAGHFVYADDGLVQAGDVRVGMKLARGEGGVAVVERVEYGLGWGLYNPQTEAGRIVVDGFVASCYTDAVRPAAAHALLAPVRAVASAGVDLLSMLDVFF